MPRGLLDTENTSTALNRVPVEMEPSQLEQGGIALKVRAQHSCSDVFGHRSGNGQARTPVSDHRHVLADRRILIVEDEALIGFALEMELEEAGAMSVGSVLTLSAAVDALEMTRVDGAILDIDLNGVDAYPLADYLIERGISFVFHTAYGGRRKLREVYPSVPVCLKPSSPDEVLNALATVFHDRSRN